MIAGLIRRADDADAAPLGAPPQIVYQDAERKADLRRGRLDGRRRIPSYTQVSDRINTDGWFTTAYSEELQELGTNPYARRAARLPEGGGSEAQPGRGPAGGAGDHSRSTCAHPGDRAAGDRIGELTADELVPRNPMEAKRGADFIRSRRRAMRNRLADKARERIEET